MTQGEAMGQYRCPQCDVPVWSNVKHADTCTWEAQYYHNLQNANQNVALLSAYQAASQAQNYTACSNAQANPQTQGYAFLSTQANPFQYRVDGCECDGACGCAEAVYKERERCARIARERGAGHISAAIMKAPL